MQEQPFRKKGLPVKFIQYRSQKEAFIFLRKILADERSVGLLHGPESSGKSTLVRQFIRELPSDLSVAFVDGARLKAADFLSSMLAQFGYNDAPKTKEELLDMVSVFVVHQTRACQPPLLILENVNRMYPSALCGLCKLAALTIHRRFALRIVLVSNRPVRQMLESPGMRNVSERLVGDFALGPLTEKETLVYLYAKLQACGIDQPDGIFPLDICDRIHLASGGLPGELDSIAMAAIDRATDSVVQPENIGDPEVQKDFSSFGELLATASSMDQGPPKVIVTLNGKTIEEVELTPGKTLLGRSALSDIIISNEFISKHHAMMVRVDDAIYLVDLNSRNGTFVNSRRVASRMLRHDDIISLGDHRIKVIDPGSRGRADMDRFNIADTATMKNIADMRRENAKRNRQYSRRRRSADRQD